MLAISILSGDKFAIVAFPEEDHSLAIVHNTWLNENGEKTYWPNESSEKTYWPNEKNPTKRRRMTVEGAKSTDSWLQVKCVARGWADTHEKALEKLQSSEYTSDLNSEEKLGRAKRKRRPALPDDYDYEPADGADTMGSGDDYAPPKRPTPPQPWKEAGVASLIVFSTLK